MRWVADVFCSFLGGKKSCGDFYGSKSVARYGHDIIDEHVCNKMIRDGQVYSDSGGAMPTFPAAITTRLLDLMAITTKSAVRLVR